MILVDAVILLSLNACACAIQPKSAFLSTKLPDRPVPSRYTNGEEANVVLTLNSPCEKKFSVST